MEIFEERVSSHTFLSAGFISGVRMLFHVAREDYLWGFLGFAGDQAFLWTHWYLVAALAKMKENAAERPQGMTMVNLMPVGVMTARGVNDNRIALNRMVQGRDASPEMWVDNTTNLLLLGLATYNTLDRGVSWVS